MRSKLADTKVSGCHLIPVIACWPELADLQEWRSATPIASLSKATLGTIVLHPWCNLALTPFSSVSVQPGTVEDHHELR